MIARDGYRDFIAELKSKADIVQVVGEVVSLRRAGRSFKGLCPFHGEKTPSFHVDPGRQAYHCFGCNKGGDVLSFVMEHEHLSFPDAARKLAERFGVAVPEWKPASVEEQARDAKRKAAAAALAAAQELFEEKLYAQDDEGRRARRYLKGRGLDSTICKTFGIGCAPRDPQALETALGRKGIDARALIDAGLLKLGEGGAAWSYFRDRITCPIRTASGKLVGFSARLLGPGEPKYLNSPDSILFRKGDNLYGLFEALKAKAFREGAPAILVEGNLDVVSLHKAGFTSAVAPLGTALTEEQARSLEKHTERLILMLDGDAAGHHAALRALPILMARSYDVSVAVLPAGADPDSYVRAEGAEAVKAILEAAVDPVTFALDEHGRGLDLDDPRFRRRVMDAVRHIVSAARSPVLRQTFYQIVAERLHVDERTVAEELARPAARPSSAPSAPARPASSPSPVPSAVLLNPSERTLLVAPFHDPRFVEALRIAVDESLLSATAASLARAILETGSVPTVDQIGESAAREAVRSVVESFARDNRALDVDGAVLALREAAVAMRAKALYEEARASDAASDDFRAAARIALEKDRLQRAVRGIDKEPPSGVASSTR